MEIEVCLSSIEDVKRAEKAGATRLELTTAMEVLGVTPSISNYIIAREITDLPILAYLRPRAGGFVYSDLEYDVIVRDAMNFYQHGARDFVVGMLTDEHKIDSVRLKDLRQRLGSECSFAFHKAFDYVVDFDEAALELIDLGFTRILTSGGPASTLDNLEVMKHLIKTYGDRIEIMPGGGINVDNVSELLEALDLKSIHLSAKMEIEDDMNYIATDIDHLKRVVSIINAKK
jgi:copper homeostasis protein